MRRTGGRRLLGAVALVVAAQTGCSAPGAGKDAGTGGAGAVGGSMGIAGAGGVVSRSEQGAMTAPVLDHHVGYRPERACRPHT